MSRPAPEPEGQAPAAERHRRLKEVLYAAAELEGAAREEYLDRACGKDRELRADVWRLLDSRGASTRDLTPASPEAAAPPGFVLEAGTRVGPYRIERLVGSGGMGTVYAAADDAGGTVALKVIHPHLMSREGVRARFVREAEVGRQVTHPNVVRTLGALRARASGQEIDLLVLEYVEGRTLKELGQALGQVPESLLREIAEQAAAGLAAIHAAGVVHRDVKPENLLITRDHRLRITDLGIAKLLEGSRDLTSEGAFIGSLHYAAPEQLDGRPVGFATDLYALGVVLYELATGVNPFAEDALAAMLRAHLERTPPPASEQNPRISAFLSAVLQTLLAKDPEARFASASELCQVFAEGEHGPWWTARRAGGARERPPRIPVERPTRCYGREQEQAALLEDWETAAAGRGHLVLLLGGAGVGKTRLLAEVADVVAQEAEVLYGAYGPGGGGGGLRGALEARYGSETLDRLLERHLGDTPHLVPAVHAWIRRMPPPAGTAALDAGAREALAARLLQGISSERPLLWIVEDLHHAGADSLRTLLALARAAARARVLLLLTSREQPPAPFVRELERLAGFRTLRLGRLGEEPMRRLLDSCFADEAAAERLCPQIARLSGGVPLFALEVLRSLEATGVLGRTENRRLRETRPIETISVPPTLRELVQERVRELTREEAETLDVAAVQGVSFEPDLVARVRGVPRIRVLEVLGHLERANGLVRSDGVALAFDHPLLQEVIYEGMPTLLRAEIHHELARAITERAGGAKSLSGEAAYLAFHHHLRGSRPTDALPLALKALRHLDRVHRGAAYVDAVERMLALAELPADERVRLGIRLGRKCQILGHREKAERALADAVHAADRLGDARLGVDARIALGFHWLERADYERALGLLAEAENLLAGQDAPELRAELLGGRGQSFWCLGRYDDARRCHEAALALGREVPLPRFEARASSDLGIVCHELGLFEEAEGHIRRSIELHHQLGDARNEAVARSNLGNVLHDLGRKAEALRSYETSLATCRRHAFRDGAAVALVNIGEVHLRLGAWEEAEQAFRECARITQEIGSRRVETYAHHGLGLLHAMRGQHEEARASLERALEARREFQYRHGIADTLQALGALCQEAGDAERAASLLTEALVVAEAVGDVNTATVAALRLAILGRAPREDALARHERARPRLRHDVRALSLWLLFQLTGSRAHLEEAGRLLAREREVAPEGAAPRMLARVPLHREVEAALRR